jgi:glycosyltransferase involved in cell wall biosynthesis
MRVLLWHVHGSWTTAFVQGRHDYLLPVLPDRGSNGLGRARTWQWPQRVVERTPAELGGEDIDLMVLQRPHEIDLARRWTGRIPGVDVPAVYLEHNAPHPHAATSLHPLADRTDIPVVHVSHFNALYWDVGRGRTYVVEHGIVDPGALYSGELPRAAVVVNEPVRRGRIVGTDLLPSFAALAPVDLFGALDGHIAGVAPVGDLSQGAMHRELARRRVYLHPVRWTSLGLSLIEAMHLGMPVVAVAATEVGRAVPPECGTVSTELAQLHEAVRYYLAEPEAAMLAGKAARRHALDQYGLARFLRDWDQILEEVAR